MRYYIPVLLACCLLVLEPLPIRARAVGGLDLSALCDHADLIAVGRAGEARRVGATTVRDTSYPAELISIPLAVDKVLKGQPKGNTIILSFAVPGVPVIGVPRAPAESGQYAVFFLRAAGDGYEVLDPDHPTIIAFPGSPQVSGTVLDLVTGEARYVLESPQATVSDKQEALSALEGSLSPVATAALRKAAHDEQVADLRLAALALLLRRNDISDLAMAENLLLHPAADTNPDVLDRLASAIRFGVHDANAIPSLARLLQADNVNVRKGAATALRRTHNSAAMKPLMQALQDSDPDVLYQAVIGLAELTHTRGGWAPGAELFEKSPQRYVDHWREWARSQR